MIPWIPWETESELPSLTYLAVDMLLPKRVHPLVESRVNNASVYLRPDADAATETSERRSAYGTASPAAVTNAEKSS